MTTAMGSFLSLLRSQTAAATAAYVTVIALAGLAISSIGAVASILRFRQVRRQIAEERQERIKLGEAISRRKPKVIPLTPIVQPIAESYAVMVPIMNVSDSPAAVAHKVEVTLTFSANNLIQKVEGGQFLVSGGGPGERSVAFRIGALPPFCSVLHPYVIVSTYEEPRVNLTYAEETAIQTMPVDKEIQP